MIEDAERLLRGMMIASAAGCAILSLLMAGSVAATIMGMAAGMFVMAVVIDIADANDSQSQPPTKGNT